MRIIDVLTSPWAIVPSKLSEIQEIYSTHLRGEKIDLKAVEAAIGEPLDNQQERGYQIINGFAEIPIHGVIAKRMNLFSRVSGGASTQIISDQITEALADDEVNGIILNIDSPGGTVDGTSELAQLVYRAREQKPVVAYSDGMIASAAYWIASAAESIIISGDTNEVGSIGVVANHVDYSAYEQRQGIKTTEIYAGKYKRIASQYEPLSEDGKQSIQDQVDYLYSVFVDAVASNRGTSTEDVLSNMADGRLFIGRQALDAGLVDGISTFTGLIETTLPVLQRKRQDDNFLNQLNTEVSNGRSKRI